MGLRQGAPLRTGSGHHAVVAAPLCASPSCSLQCAASGSNGAGLAPCEARLWGGAPSRGGPGAPPGKRASHAVPMRCWHVESGAAGARTSVLERSLQPAGGPQEGPGSVCRRLPWSTCAPGRAPRASQLSGSLAPASAADPRVRVSSSRHRGAARGSRPSEAALGWRLLRTWGPGSAVRSWCGGARGGVGEAVGGGGRRGLVSYRNIPDGPGAGPPASS